MCDTKISEPAPNWCRTCGRRPNDPMAALCLDTHHRTLERIHPQAAELAEQQAIAEFLKERDEALGCPDATDGERAESARLIAALAATGKQQVGDIDPRAALGWEKACAATGLRQVGEVQGVGITADWVLGYLNTDAPEDSREAVRNAFTEWNALAARQPGAQVPRIDGYQRAFYEMAGMLGMTAQPISPNEVWETQMRPMVKALMELVEACEWHEIDEHGNAPAVAVSKALALVKKVKP